MKTGNRTCHRLSYVCTWWSHFQEEGMVILHGGFWTTKLVFFGFVAALSQTDVKARVSRAMKLLYGSVLQCKREWSLPFGFRVSRRKRSGIIGGQPQQFNVVPTNLGFCARQELFFYPHPWQVRCWVQMTRVRCLIGFCWVGPLSASFHELPCSTGSQSEGNLDSDMPQPEASPIGAGSDTDSLKSFSRPLGRGSGVW
jgi:hypothetical protein